MERRGRRWPIALAGALVVAEAAVLLLRPRHGIVDPLPVSARSYFSAAELDRARDFRRPQLALYGGQLVVQLALLGALVRRPPRFLLAARRPWLVGAAGGATISVALTVATLPLAAVARGRSLDVGLATQAWPAWAGDVALSAAISAGLAAAGAVGLLALMRRFGARWWLPGSAAVVGVGAVFLFAGPVVLDPLFNRFTPLAPGSARDDVLELAGRAGVDVGQVLEIDASRRTSAANAYVGGLGQTKRVVLYDTLLESFSREERRLVIAHELAHVHHGDLGRGLLYVALVAPAGLLAVGRLVERLAPARAAPGSPAVLPAAALAVALVVFAVTTISNQLSRAVEARADAYAMELTGAPRSLVAFERRIARRNLSDPDPPSWVTFLFATHPPAVERIGAAEAVAAGRGRATGRRTRGGS